VHQQLMRHFFPLLLVATIGCPAQVPVECIGPCIDPIVDEENKGPPRFYVDPPFGVGFDCVTIGCSTTQLLHLENRGGGALQVVLTRFSVDSSPDFALSRADGSPLTVDEASSFTLTSTTPVDLVVTYTPTDASADEADVWIDYRDAASTSPIADRVELPVTARQLGNPVAVNQQTRLDFGYVPIGTTVTRELLVANTATAGILSVGPLELEAAEPTFAPDASGWGVRYANPGDDARFVVSFTPTSAVPVLARALVRTNDGAHPAFLVELEGTALAEPRLGSVAVIDFAEVRIGTPRTIDVVLRNLGGQELTIAPAVAIGADIGLSVPVEPITLPVLGSHTLTVSLLPSLGGVFDGQILLTTNDPAQPLFALQVLASVQSPALTPTPAVVDFGNVVQSWAPTPQEVTITNTGFGDLSVDAITVEVGGSSDFQLVGVPQLPVKLAAGDFFTFAVRAQSTVLGAAAATFLIQSDAVDNVDTIGGVSRVRAQMNVITCAQGCPVGNGTPSCGNGVCEIATCNDGFHDANNGFGDGCECTEDVDIFGNRNDVAPQCPGFNMGTISDCSEPHVATFNGTLHDETDVDLYFVRMVDEGCFCFFCDQFTMQLRLTAPPGVQMCRRVIAGVGNACGGENLLDCSSTNIDDGGSIQVSGSDSREVMLMVRWDPAFAQPMCVNYNLFVNARD
jgi:hypothetical protein